MLSKMFSLAARVTNFWETQKHAPRRNVNLSLRVSLAGPCQTNSGPLPPSMLLRPTLNGRTRDISENGLALLLPAVHLDGRYFTDGERKLNVSLDLERDTVELEVLPVRYERLADDSGYLVGARIIAVTEANRARYREFLTALSKRRNFAAALAPQAQHKSASLSISQ